ncbi:MAG: sigma-70 family RNA polymerase sigma factor [Planctomycetota bacterium]
MRDAVPTPGGPWPSDAARPRRPGALHAPFADDFARLVREGSRRLLLAIDAHDLGDVAQDVALDYLQAAARSDGRALDVRWLRKRAGARLRAWARERAEHLSVHESVPLELCPCPESPRDDVDHVRERLPTLSDELRAILALRFLHGVEYTRLARVLGVPPATLKARVYRSRCGLRFALGPAPRRSGDPALPPREDPAARPGRHASAGTPTHSAQARSSASLSTSSSVTKTR